MNYDIEFKPRALKELEVLPKSTQRRILARIEALRNDLAGDVKRLTDFTPEYRLRVGDYRILFEAAEHTWLFIASCIEKMPTNNNRWNPC